MQLLLAFTITAVLITLIITINILLLLMKSYERVVEELRALQHSMQSRQGNIAKTTVAGPLFRKERARTTQRSQGGNVIGRMGKLIPHRGGEYGNPHDGELSQDTGLPTA